MREFFLGAFVSLFVIIDPFAVIPVFIALTRNDTKVMKRKTALKSSVIAAILLISFAFLGDKLLDFLGISEPAFRIAGGFLLLLAAIEMVVAKSSGIRSTTGEEAEEAIHRDDISVFPLAIPLIAGPGALTTTVVLMRQAEAHGFWASAGIVGILISVLLINYVCLLLSDFLMKILGVTGTNVLTRVFGIILSALAVQYIITGLTLVVKSIMAGAV